MTTIPSTESLFPRAAVPGSARAVIVGGGIIGCSVAYHLSRAGWSDVVLLEQNRIAGGTTWHAAGMVGCMRTCSAMVQIARCSADLYAELEHAGHATGWKQVGSLLLASCDDRMTLLRRQAALARFYGVEVEFIGPSDIATHFPLLRTDDLAGAAWVPGDGKVNPRDTAIALAQAASARGAKIMEDVRVDAICVHDGRATGVRTEHGEISAEIVVLCGGMWSRAMAMECGVDVPQYPLEHHYILSESLEGMHDEVPCTRDMDGRIYLRGEGDRILLGAFQEYTHPWKDDIPADFSYELLDEDWDSYRQPLEAGCHRVPSLEGCRWDRFINGPESFTPDNNFLMGEAPGMDALFVATGFNSVGIASAGGAGMLLAQWIEGGEPPVDLFAVDIRRFSPQVNNRRFLRERVTEMLGLHYRMAWPDREVATARGLRKSPLHDRLAARGAVFGQKSGLERPLYFSGSEAVAPHAGTFGLPPWFEQHRVEHMAAREAVAVFDQTSFSKYILKGRDALVVLQRLCGADMDVAEGRTVYTGMFNHRGRFKSDLTVVRLAEREFYIITATAQRTHDFCWIERHIAPGEQAELVDVTSGYCVMGVMGPRSRELLSPLTDADLSLDAFPFGTAQEIGIDQYSVRAVRLTYVGELGWELHVAMDQAQQVYDVLHEHGGPQRLVDAGHTAINSLRLEKAYRAWGSDITADDTPLEAGLSFAVSWDKDPPFIGREALLVLREEKLKKRMAAFVLQDPDIMLWHGETIWRDGACVGYASSASYGHAVGGAVALGYVRDEANLSRESLEQGIWEIDVAGKKVPATLHLRSPWDPGRERILV